MKRTVTIITIVLLSAFSALSRPARPGVIYLSQPDGTTFGALVRGDEFVKITTTSQGHAIIQDSEGWWCYAEYDEEGVKSSSGYRVGTSVPSGVLSLSRHIPYGKISGKTAAKRLIVPDEDGSVIARMMRNKGPRTKGDRPLVKHGLVIPVQYKDVKLTYSREDFVKLLTQPGYKENGAEGSAKEYFDAQFNGMVEFQFEVVTPVTLSGIRSQYGGNGSDDTDKAPAQMIAEACRLADDDIDFSIYDDDGDGVVDNVFVFFAGGDEADGAGSDCIWSHAWYIRSGAGIKLELDGKTIDRYACASELSRTYTTLEDYRDVFTGIGTFCHEYSHTFGLPDMYDTDYEESGGYAAGLWTWTSLMDGGNMNNNGNTPPNLNAIEREILGISDPVIIDADGGYSLEPVHEKGKYYRIDTDTPDEYYLLECRSDEKWDKHIGGKGMLVYHVDKSGRGTGWSDSYDKDLTASERWNFYNELNCRPDHQCADMVEADMRQDGYTASEEDAFNLARRNIQGVFFPSGQNNSIPSDGISGLGFWSGERCKASITNIRTDGAKVLFNVIGFSETVLPPEVTAVKAEAFMDAAIIRFESDREFEGEAVVAWGRTGMDKDTVKVTPYEPGKYSVTLEGLQPDNKTYTASIHFEISGIAGDASSVSFMTKKSPSVKWPFIYMTGIKTNSDGTLPPGTKLPLRLCNATDAAEISWEFNGQPTAPEGDGYLTVTKGGVLKAHIIWEDGSHETVMKEIIIGAEGQL